MRIKFRYGIRQKHMIGSEIEMWQEPLDMPIIESTWTADEELLLLEGVETLGFGNWEGISELVVTKSKQKCQKHYLRFYVDCPTYPKPDIPSTAPTVLPADYVPSEGALGGFPCPAYQFFFRSLSIFSKYSRLPDSPDEPDIDTKPAKYEPKVMPPNPTPLDLAGYMAKRGDFATEFENEAEMIIADLTFAPDDTQEDRCTCWGLLFAVVVSFDRCCLWLLRALLRMLVFGVVAGFCWVQRD